MTALCVRSAAPLMLLLLLLCCASCRCDLLPSADTGDWLPLMSFLIGARCCTHTYHLKHPCCTGDAPIGSVHAQMTSMISTNINQGLNNTTSDSRSSNSSTVDSSSTYSVQPGSSRSAGAENTTSGSGTVGSSDSGSSSGSNGSSDSGSSSGTGSAGNDTTGGITNTRSTPDSSTSSDTPPSGCSWPGAGSAQYNDTPVQSSASQVCGLGVQGSEVGVGGSGLGLSWPGRREGCLGATICFPFGFFVEQAP